MLRLILPQFSRCLFQSSKVYRFSSNNYNEGDIREINREIEDLFGVSSNVKPSNLEQITANSKPNVTDFKNYKTNEDKSLTHVDKHGKVKMVSITEKRYTRRIATASARVKLNSEAFEKLKDSKLKKGDVLTVSQIAGIMAAKQTSTLIPLCHNINLSEVNVELNLKEENQEVLVMSKVECTGSTGVEMEAMVSAAIASLTVYDMCKAIDKSIEINKLRLEFKSGGKSGTFTRFGNNS